VSIIAPILVGVGIALLIVVSARALGFHSDRSFYPTLVVVIVSYYPLFAVMAGQGVVEEIAIASIFTAIAVLGVLRWWWLVPAALLLHGLFDLVHHTVLGRHGAPIWWPPFCAAVDIVLAASAAYLSKRVESGQRQF